MDESGRRVGRRTGQRIAGVAVSLLFVTGACAQDREIERIADSIRSATDAASVRQGLAELAAIDSASAATAFADELVRLRSSLDRDSGETLVPYLMPVFGFTDSADVRQSLVPAFERLLAEDIQKYENLYLSAALAKFGDQNRVQWLVDEYHRAQPDPGQFSYAATTFELLCETNQDEAVRFVVDEAVRSVDPSQKLATEHCLRENGNPAALELMRRWDSVESGDFDLIVAKHYLQSIAEFGDNSDTEFVEWVNSNADDLFLPEDFEAEIRPLIETARETIGGSAETQWRLAPMLGAIAMIGIVLIGLIAYRRRRSA